MKVALFLDVDRTLTKEPIQLAFAKALGCEAEFSKLEAKFQAKHIKSNEFGDGLIALFKSKDFRLEAAESINKNVSLEPLADELLRLSVDKYLVSSGPNYFIEPLARKYDIPVKTNVGCSQYGFSPVNGIIESCKAVEDQDKAEFVKERVRDYDITIGIGDSGKHDGPFVSHCTIRLLKFVEDGYMHFTSINSVILLIKDLTEKKVTIEFEPGNLTVRDLVNKLTIKTWIQLGSAIPVAFGAGLAVGKLFK